MSHVARMRAIVADMRRWLDGPAAAAALASARERHPALADFAAMADMLRALEGRSAGIVTKGRITRAVLDEYQARPAEAWAAALVVAYYPMLWRLRCRLGCDGMEPEDLDHLVVECFLVEARRLRTADRPILGLRQRTERGVFRTLRAHAVRTGILCLRPVE